MKRLTYVLERGRSLWLSEDGPTGTEYAILLALLVLVAMGAMQGIGSRVFNVYTSINDAIPEGV